MGKGYQFNSAANLVDFTAICHHEHECGNRVGEQLIFFQQEETSSRARSIWEASAMAGKWVEMTGMKNLCGSVQKTDAAKQKKTEALSQRYFLWERKPEGVHMINGSHSSVNESFLKRDRIY